MLDCQTWHTALPWWQQLLLVEAIDACCCRCLPVHHAANYQPPNLNINCSLIKAATYTQPSRAQNNKLAPSTHLSYALHTPA
jgi:hypothetical protein